MSTEQSQVDYIVDQIQEAGLISYRKMFGEYAIYCDTKIVGLVCDNQFFVKPTDAGERFVNGIKMAPPYPGAKPYFAIEEQLDRREWITELIKITAEDLPFPKPKKSRTPKERA